MLIEKKTFYCNNCGMIDCHNHLQQDDLQVECKYIYPPLVPTCKTFLWLPFVWCHVCDGCVPSLQDLHFIRWGTCGFHLEAGNRDHWSLLSYWNSHTSNLDRPLMIQARGQPLASTSLLQKSGSSTHAPRTAKLSPTRASLSCGTIVTNNKAVSVTCRHPIPAPTALTIFVLPPTLQ